MTPTMEDKQGQPIQVASAATMFAGVWLSISPWLYGSYTDRSAWNSWVVGSVVLILAVIRLSRPLGTVALSWINCVLGVWTFFSPWIYGYLGQTGRSVNNFVAGAIMFLAAAWSATHAPKPPEPRGVASANTQPDV